MPIVQRFFHQDMPDDGPVVGEAQPLTNYIDKRVVVILGNPGIGKTTELEQAAAQEANAGFCTVSQFLTDPIELFQGKTIYLDALDEHRAELRQGVSIINGIRGRLRGLGSPKVRISCRSEEWQQGSDLKSLSDVTGGEPVYILKMQPLGEEDIRAIAAEDITDVDTFLAGAQERDLGELLGNPETLKLYLKVYQNGGGWPETRAKLMEQSTKLLISEENEQHNRARGDAISDKRLMHAAEDLSAILLFGDKEGVALSKAARSEIYILLQELPDIDLDATQVAVRRRLFSSDAPEQVHPEHKTTGDYLAAKALVRRILDKSLPLGRALSLLTGKDGGPLSHMRDVYAWMIALLPEQAEQLIKTDPFGAMIYGDAGQWSVATRRTALKLLSAYAANTDPWFRADAWYAPLLGGLVHPELIEDFRNILTDEPSPHVTNVVLSALEYGSLLPELGDDLLSFIRDSSRPQFDWVRDDALRVFTRVCPERIDERVTLLADVKAGVIPDDGHVLRAVLLGELYPVEVGLHEVVHYFSNANIVGTGTMDGFIRNELIEKTPDSDLPILANAILMNPNDVKKLGEFNRRKLNGALVRRLLESHGDVATPDQIYAWLGIYIDRHRTAYLDKEDADIIRAYFETHPKLYVGLFRHWLGQTVPDEKHNYRFHHTSFHYRTLLASPPFDFPQTLLTWAAEETDSDKAEFLFEEVVNMTMGGDLGAFSVSLDDLFDYVEAHPLFADTLERNRTTTVSDWQWEEARRNQNIRKGEEGVRAHNVEILSPRLEEVRTGKDLHNVDWGAQNWFGLTYAGRLEDEPIERIRRQSNYEIAEAITEGFEALLKTTTPRMPGEIVALDFNSQRALESFAVLAGADILAERSQEEFLALPGANLKAALAYHLVHSVGGEDRAWGEQIMSAHPGLAREVLAEIWRARLAGGAKQHLTGAYIGRTENISTPIILVEIPILLDENPALPPRILEDLLKAILHHGDAEVLRPLAPMALADRRVRGESRTYWLAVAALFSPGDYARSLDGRLRTSSRDVWAAHDIFTAGAGTLMNGQESVPQLQMSISILGKYFNNVPLFVGERTVRARDVEDAARSIRELIDTLAGLPTDEAAQAFGMLIADPALHEWHNHLRHGLAIQAKNLRDAQFERPSAQDVCTLLAGGAPANMKDFQGLAVDILDDIAAEVRGDNTNMWKSFWTHAGKGKLDRPEIENDSRDVLLRWIRPHLTPRGITSEPEGAAADLKQVDIRLTSAGTGTLPIEVKCDSNDELWTAMRDQLLERYTNDPNSGGYGIYLVIWHGKRGDGCKSPPKELGIDNPTTAMELQAALEAIKPDPRFVVRVIDVSKPHD